MPLHQAPALLLMLCHVHSRRLCRTTILLHARVVSLIQSSQSNSPVSPTHPLQEAAASRPSPAADAEPGSARSDGVLTASQRAAGRGTFRRSSYTGSQVSFPEHALRLCRAYIPAGSLSFGAYQRA